MCFIESKRGTTQWRSSTLNMKFPYVPRGEHLAEFLNAYIPDRTLFFASCIPICKIQFLLLSCLKEVAIRWSRVCRCIPEYLVFQALPGPRRTCQVEVRHGEVGVLMGRAALEQMQRQMGLFVQFAEVMVTFQIVNSAHSADMLFFVYCGSTIMP